jgi:hypothetical protein
MTSHEVDIAALAAFREALRAYPAYQMESLDAVDQAIGRTRAALEDARRSWEREVESCRDQAIDCQREAVYAAAEGGYIDCSPYESALYQAEESLRRVIEAQWHFDDAASHYRTAALRYGDILENGLSRASTYLDVCITIFSTYSTTQLTAHPALTTTLRNQALAAGKAGAGNVPSSRSGSSPERGESGPEQREGGPEQRG